MKLIMQHVVVQLRGLFRFRDLCAISHFGVEPTHFLGIQLGGVT